MKNFELGTFSSNLEKADLMNFSENSYLKEIYDRFH